MMIVSKNISRAVASIRQTEAFASVIFCDFFQMKRDFSVVVKMYLLIIILLRSSQAFLFVEVAIETEHCVFSDTAEETLQTN